MRAMRVIVPRITRISRSDAGARCAACSRLPGFLRGRNRGPKSQQIAVHAETADLSLYDLGEHGVMPKCLAGVDVRHVDLDDRHGENGQRVADAIAVVRPRTGVDEHRGDLLLKAAVNPLTHFLFAVGLETDHFDAKLLAQCLQARVDLAQRRGSVLDRVALAEHVVVDAMEHQDFHHDYSSIRQRMFRSTVCPDLAACTIPSVIRRLARPSRAVTRGSTSPRTTAPKCSN